MNLKIVQQTQENNEKNKNINLGQENINKKIGRNDPCFCGSRKKYKRCCGALQKVN